MTPSALRASLFNPPNAVPDTGINMRSGRVVVIYPPQKEKFMWPGNLSGEFWLAPDLPRQEFMERRSNEIRRAVSDVWHVSVTSLKSFRRDQAVIIPRHVAIALCRHLTALSLPQIARVFGRRDHTTILHAVRKMAPHIAAVAMELPPGATPIEWARAMRRRVVA